MKVGTSQNVGVEEETIQLPKPLISITRRFIETNRKYGFESVEEFVAEAVRKYILKFEELEKLNAKMKEKETQKMNEANVKILDSDRLLRELRLLYNDLTELNSAVTYRRLSYLNRGISTAKLVGDVEQFNTKAILEFKNKLEEEYGEFWEMIAIMRLASIVYELETEIGKLKKALEEQK